MQCYLETSDLEACKARLSRLLNSQAPNPLNNYLAYCLALKTKDTERGGVFVPGSLRIADQRNTAREALTVLDRAAAMSEQLLYACVSKTLDFGTPEQAASVLLRLLNKHDFNPPKHINLPTLLR